MTLTSVERAPAKVNLTLRVLARRPDGYHELESLVVFADCGDALTFTPDGALSLVVRGPTASSAGAIEENLVLKAANALAAHVDGLALGRFVLFKRLPVAAGLGGGSADAAAALRLLARSNRIALDDVRLRDAARATGADVPVCLDPRSRLMRGIGDVLSEPLTLPRLPAVLVNPGVSVATKEVFARLKPGRDRPSSPETAGSASLSSLLAELAGGGNDLEEPALMVAPVIAEVLNALRCASGCRLARMSGSGATCFGLFNSRRAADAAARALRAAQPTWWVRATMLG